MANLFSIPSFSDHRGSLSVIENLLPFSVQRVYYIYDVPPGVSRGGHRHGVTEQALVCLSGSCTITVQKEGTKHEFHLSSPNEGLYVEPEDWHVMSDFSPASVLLVLASHLFDEKDYIDDPL